MVEVVVWLVEHCLFSDLKWERLPVPTPHYFLGVAPLDLASVLCLSDSLRFLVLLLSPLLGPRMFY